MPPAWVQITPVPVAMSDIEMSCVEFSLKFMCECHEICRGITDDNETICRYLWGGYEIDPVIRVLVRPSIPLSHTLHYQVMSSDHQASGIRYQVQ